jgi:hypothetical protein
MACKKCDPKASKGAKPKEAAPVVPPVVEAAPSKKKK